MSESFWKNKKLHELTGTEWESLCDGCGKCCLNKLEDEARGDIYYTNVRCKLLDQNSCKCTNYLNRVVEVPSCVVLGPELVATLPYMPESCSYRLVYEGKDLPGWHHLVCGDKERIHRQGHSVRGKTISEDEVKNWQDQIIDLETIGS
jgi:uncharacterized protein